MGLLLGFCWEEAGGEAQSRTGDTMIFSHVLYQLSYLATEEMRAR